jgi:hypothetical protein
MMTPEQIAELATVRADYKHIMDALREIKEAQAAQGAELAAIKREVAELKEGSPSKIFNIAVKVAVGLLAIAGAWQLLARLGGK